MADKIILDHIKKNQKYPESIEYYRNIIEEKQFLLNKFIDEFNKKQLELNKIIDSINEKEFEELILNIIEEHIKKEEIELIKLKKIITEIEIEINNFENIIKEKENEDFTLTRIKLFPHPYKEVSDELKNKIQNIFKQGIYIKHVNGDIDDILFKNILTDIENVKIVFESYNTNPKIEMPFGKLEPFIRFPILEIGSIKTGTYGRENYISYYTILRPLIYRDILGLNISEDFQYSPFAKIYSDIEGMNIFVNNDSICFYKDTNLLIEVVFDVINVKYTMDIEGPNNWYIDPYYTATIYI